MHSMTLDSNTQNDSYYGIHLSPSGSLCFDCTNISALPPEIASLAEQFALDWRGGWFSLAAIKSFVSDTPTLFFWQRVATHFLTLLCHEPAEEGFTDIAVPDDLCLSNWLLALPPMVGGEYLSKQMVALLWSELNYWVSTQAIKHGGIRQFLTESAPKWQQVGCVSFHLAENKQDARFPFAFLATYSTGFSSGGKLKHLPLKEALQKYSGENNRSALVKLLKPVQMASEKCPWVQDLLVTNQLYQPLAWTSEKAYTFLCDIPQLEESGLSVRIPNWWKKRSRPQVTVTIGSANQPRIGVNSMLDFNVQLALGEEQLSEEELQELLTNNAPLQHLRGQWVEVDREKLQEALTHWKQVQKLHKRGEISFVDGMRMLAGAPSLSDSGSASIESNYWVKLSAGKALTDILNSLRDPSQITSQKLDTGSYTLRPYQHEGVNWMALVTGLGLGACLADDMGLGKTVQILTLLLLKQRHSSNDEKNPSLLVVPASLLANWNQEAQKFTPTLRLCLLHPSLLKLSVMCIVEESPLDYFGKFDLVVTTYSMVSKLALLSKVTWDLVILDEAQAIKNAGTQQTKAVKAIPAKARIALTGTPIENRLSDLWSLFDFLNPGLLGSVNRFKEYVSRLTSTPYQFESLRKLTAPYILRRMKTDPKVIQDLPQKIETSAYCHLTKQQVTYYQAVVDELKQKLDKLDSKSRRGAVLNAILSLKQICNHPCHYTHTGEYHPAHSGKFERLRELCEELASRQEKVLIFTQFSEIICHLEHYVSQIFGRRGLMLDGSTPISKRRELVETFQTTGGPPFFVLSLKAGGTGLTLTEASHVILFDRWWNPAVENQAADRAFRIGQKKNVQVHKFITQGTIEEQIEAILTSKQKLAAEVLSSTEEVKITELSNEELLNLVSLDLEKAMIS